VSNEFIQTVNSNLSKISVTLSIRTIQSNDSKKKVGKLLFRTTKFVVTLVFIYISLKVHWNDF